MRQLYKGLGENGRAFPFPAPLFRYSLSDQAVKFTGVFASDLALRSAGQMSELPFDMFLGIGKDAVGVRIIGGPHHGLYPHVIEVLGTYAVVLKARPALTAPVFARLHFQIRNELCETVFVFVVHALEYIGNPADVGLPKHD